MISAYDFLQTCNITLMSSGHVSIIILMRECDSKYREICFKKCFYNNLSYMNIERFVIKANEQGTSRKQLRPEKLRPCCCLENLDLKNITNSCLPLVLQDVLLTIRRYDVDISTICKGWERWRRKQPTLVASQK